MSENIGLTLIKKTELFLTMRTNQVKGNSFC